ncbi:polysaccharide deacetylase family protein [Kitasatospora aburaviensis]
MITALPDGTRATALTFDACGGPGGSGYDAALIEFLRAHGVPATLFLNARWIDANPAEFEQLAAEPLFEIANHGTAHRPLSVTGRSAYGIAGTRDPGEVYDEIAGNTAKLTALLGRPPRFFRSGTAHYDDVATRIAADLHTRVAGFTVNADGGATFTAAQVRAEVAAAPPGAILIAHMNHPASGTAPASPPPSHPPHRRPHLHPSLRRPPLSAAPSPVNAHPPECPGPIPVRGTAPQADISGVPPWSGRAT